MSTVDNTPKILEEGFRSHNLVPHPLRRLSTRSYLYHAYKGITPFWRCLLLFNLALSLYSIHFLLQYIFEDVACLIRGQPHGCASIGHIGPRNPAYLIQADNGAVASENELCSVIGVDVLREGGSAVDAAISAALCTGVVNMFSSGIGGGGWMIVRVPPSTPNSSSEVYSIDFREVAPAGANATMFTDDPRSAMFGGLSVAVPSELRGFEEAHRRWGKLEWRRLVQPSVELAEGWRVGRELGRRIPWFESLMLDNRDWRDIFAPNGLLLREGDVIRRTNYSRTLAAIAEHGPDAFYTGPIADSIIRKVQSTSGILTHSDLSTYKVNVTRALKGTYRGRKVYTTHAPTSGPVLLHMLNLMEGFQGLVGEGRTRVNVHRMVEAMKFGFAARTNISDPHFEDGGSRVAAISTKEHAQLVFNNFTDDRTHRSEYYQPVFGVKADHGTSHTSVVDKDGMAVSLTSTVNLVFGSELLDPETGVILNDEMDDFSTPGRPNYFGLLPSPYNFPAPHKRPLSSITPVITEHPNGTLSTVLGGSGGSQIFPSVFQVMLNLDWGMGMSEAVEFGRVHDQLYPWRVDVDDVLGKETVEALRERGHNVSVVDVNRVAAVVQGVVVQDGKILAASDSRKNGIAAGY